MAEVKTIWKAKRSLRKLKVQLLRAFDISSFEMHLEKQQQELDNSDKSAMKTLHGKVMFGTNSNIGETLKLYINFNFWDEKREFCWRENLDTFYWIPCHL